VLLDQIFELIDVPLFLRFCAPPELLDIWPAAGIGDVLVESPQAVQPPAQIVDQVVIVIFDSPRFAKVFVFLVGRHRHRVARFIERTTAQKKTDVVEGPKASTTSVYFSTSPPTAARLPFI
jgi:hypothetical protein